jgi:hypothetical protein
MIHPQDEHTDYSDQLRVRIEHTLDKLPTDVVWEIKRLFVELYQISNEMMQLRDMARAAAFRHLRQLVAPARSVANRFNEFEMLVLLAAYDSLPTEQLRGIDVSSVERQSCRLRASLDFNDSITFAAIVESHGKVSFSHCLACFLVIFVTGRAGTRLGSLIANQEGLEPPDKTIAALLETAEKVRSLDLEQALALQVLLEGARAVPAALDHYDRWWHPDMLLRLLEQPEMDWPKHEVT